MRRGETHNARAEGGKKRIMRSNGSGLIFEQVCFDAALSTSQPTAMPTQPSSKPANLPTNQPTNQPTKPPSQQAVVPLFPRYLSRLLVQGNFFRRGKRKKKKGREEDRTRRGFLLVFLAALVSRGWPNGTSVVVRPP